MSSPCFPLEPLILMKNPQGKMITVHTNNEGLSTGSAKPKHSTNLAPQSPGKGASRFKVNVHVDLPVAAEVILEASNAKEAGALAENIVKQKTVMEKLHKTLGIQTITVPDQSNQQINVQIESLLEDITPEAMAWKMVDLDSGEHWEPVFQSLIF